MHHIQSLKTIFPIISLFCMLVLLPLPGHAEIYKWVDEQGTTHYTETAPPSDIESESIEPPDRLDSTQAIKNLEAQEKTLRELREARIEKASEAEKTKQHEEQRKEACEQSKSRLASYQQRPRVAIEDKDGNVQRITEERRQAEITKSNDYVKKYCG